MLRIEVLTFYTYSLSLQINYDKTFARFGLKISTGKTETGDIPLKNTRVFKYLGII